MLSDKVLILIVNMLRECVPFMGFIQYDHTVSLQQWVQQTLPQ